MAKGSIKSNIKEAEELIKTITDELNNTQLSDEERSEKEETIRKIKRYIRWQGGTVK